MSEHFLDLPGAAIVATEQVLDAKAMIADAFDARAMAAVHGAAGTGKSFAVAQALIDIPARDWVSMDFRARPTLRDVRQSLIQALGAGVSSYAPFDADRSLKRVLAERPRLVVVDEAQWLNRECFEYLRYLHDTPSTCFSLLFVGGVGCYEVLRREPMLDSRLYAHLRFGHMSLNQVLAVIPVYHSLYEAVGDDVLALIDRTCAHGNFRNWAKFTRHAQVLCQRSDRARVDDEVARNVFRALGGGSHA